MKEILHALLAEVQHLRVGQAVLIARLDTGATGADLRDVRNQAIEATGTELKRLYDQIEAL